jgi:predicted small secreted protein|tara:strand:- start:17702 stop:17893 length:192 start_codon:yes stop_codon:yes gene_type:complete
MKRTLYILLFAFFTATSFSTLTSCREEKSTGEKIEDAIDDTGDAIEEGAEEVEDAVDDATDDH